MQYDINKYKLHLLSLVNFVSVCSIAHSKFLLTFLVGLDETPSFKGL